MEKLSRSRSIVAIGKTPEFSRWYSVVDKAIPYRIPKGYLSWETVKKILTISMLLHHEQHPDMDAASYFCHQRACLWFAQSAPLYLISNNLLRAFESSEVLDREDLLSQIQLVLPTFMVLFPENSIISPVGGVVDYAVVHLGDRKNPELSKGERFGVKIDPVPQEHELNLHWSCVDSKETVWFSGMGLKDGKIITKDHQLGTDPLLDTDLPFLDRMRNIVFQILLCLCFKPELIELIPDRLSVHNNSSKSRQITRKEPSYLIPRILGKSYRNTPVFKGSLGEKQYKVKGWWKKGHFREQPYGKRDNPEHKTIWIKPTWCEPS